MNQAKFVAEYTKKHHYPMNPDLFTRSDELLVYYMENIYLSIKKEMGINAYFTFKVINFDVVFEYDKVREILSKHLETAINKSVKLKGVVDNRHEFNDLESSDLGVLVVTVLMEAYDGRKIKEYIMAFPKVVNKFYYRINGNLRYALNQLVDASTYNNQTSKAKSPMVVLKCNFPPIHVYRNDQTLVDINGVTIPAFTFEVDVFKKSVPAVEHIFAKMGYMMGMRFMGLDGIIYINDSPIPHNQDHYYIFQPKKTVNLFISVPKSIFNQNPVVQHITYVLFTEYTRKFATLEGLNTRDMWLEALGRHFSLATPRSKAISVLSSFEFTYDKTTKELLKLPEEEKQDVYCVLRWLIYEYNALILKDNLDVSLKRIRVEEYMAYLLAPKIGKAIYALGDMGETVNLQTIETRMNIPYDFLVNEIAKQSIVVFADMVTDNDSFVPLKVSRGGPSSISEKNNSAALPVVYRHLHPSSLNIMDATSSGNSQPGITSTLIPFLKIYSGGYLIPDYKEPNEWKEVLDKQIKELHEEIRLKEVVEFRRKILNQSEVPELEIDDYKISEEQRQHLLETANR